MGPRAACGSAYGNPVPEDCLCGSKNGRLAFSQLWCATGATHAPSFTAQAPPTPSARTTRACGTHGPLAASPCTTAAARRARPRPRRACRASWVCLGGLQSPAPATSPHASSKPAPPLSSVSGMCAPCDCECQICRSWSSADGAPKSGHSLVRQSTNFVMSGSPASPRANNQAERARGTAMRGASGPLRMVTGGSSFQI